MYASVEDVDFLVGCLAESPRPEGYLISETAFYVFIMNASRRLLCDRFYQVGRIGFRARVRVRGMVRAAETSRQDYQGLRVTGDQVTHVVRIERGDIPPPATE